MSLATQRLTSRDALLSAISRVPRRYDEDDNKRDDYDDDAAQLSHHACCVPAVISAHVGVTIMTRMHDKRVQRGIVVATT